MLQVIFVPSIKLNTDFICFRESGKDFSKVLLHKEDSFQRIQKWRGQRQYGEKTEPQACPWKAEDGGWQGQTVHVQSDLRLWSWWRDLLGVVVGLIMFV